MRIKISYFIIIYIDRSQVYEFRKKCIITLNIALSWQTVLYLMKCRVMLNNANSDQKQRSDQFGQILHCLLMSQSYMGFKKLIISGPYSFTSFIEK